MTWWVVESRGMKLRYWVEDEGKPWRRRMVGRVGDPLLWGQGRFVFGGNEVSKETRCLEEHI